MIAIFLLVCYTVISSDANMNRVKVNLKCPDSFTRCSVPTSEVRGCCHLSNATCCDDGQHCCPSGFKCDLNAGKCMKDPSQTQELVPMGLNFNPKPVNNYIGDQIYCPDKTSCPTNYFCCNYVIDRYTCCPANTVCCTLSGEPQCCPDGYICKGSDCIKACP